MKKIAVPLVLVLCGFIAGLVVTGRMRSASDTLAESRSPAGPASAMPVAEQHPAPGPQHLAPGTGGPDFTHVAGTAVKGVANISSLQVTRTSNSPFSSDPFFRYFFGDDDQFFGSRDRRSLSLGSGVVVSADGYIVTNNHVVGDNVREITVTLPDKREIHGRVIGTDPATDIALLKINVAGLPVIPWADSSQLKVGEWVLAIGSPFSLSQTVTAGIVSATGRGGLGFADYEDFIQTDAAINPGNSGGALVNTRGELVGINTGIYSQSGGYQGIGFAIPSNLAKRVIADLMKYGEVRRGSINGIATVENLTGELAQELGDTTTSGALIARMMRNSDAYQAGLRPGDVIITFNGQAIDNASQFYRLVADAKIGSTATMKVLRNGRTFDTKLPIVSSARARR